MRLLGAGDNVVDRYVDDGVLYPGGNAVNVAVFAARAGAEAGYLGVIGDDASGRLVRQSLVAEGVEVSRLREEDGPHAWADVALSHGDRTFINSSRGVALFEPTEEDYASMNDYDVVHSGYAGSLLPFIEEIASRTLASFDFGTRISVDAAGNALEHLYLASFSLGEGDRENAALTANHAVIAGARFALVSRGADGAMLASAEGTWEQAAFPVDVVDTLGAGDALIASLLVGLLGGRDPREALADGCRAAAQACTYHGAFGHGRSFRSEAAGMRKEHSA